MSQHKKDETQPLVLSEGTFPIIEQVTTGMPGGFFIYHATGKEELIYANNALIRIFGCDDLADFKRYTGFVFRGMVHPEDWARVSESIQLQINHNDEALDYVEYRIIRKDGSIRWLQDYGHFVHTKRYGDVFYVFVEDATERHLKELSNTRMTQLLQERLETLGRLEHETTALRLVHEILRSGMWSMEFNEQGKMVSVLWSEEFRAMVGYQSEADFPNTLEAWSDLIHPEDKQQVLKAYYGTIADYTGKRVYDVKYRLLTKNRGYRWFQAAGKLSRRPDGTPITYVGMFVDITEQKQKDEELETQRRMLEDALGQAQRANRAKTVFLNNMSHDIRTPMNAIIGFTALASNHIESKELVKGYLDKIMSSSNHLLSLINDVLDMSRIESGKMHIEETACSLTDVMHDLKTIVQADIRSKRLEFFIDTMDVVNENVICDRLRLKQVLLNVVGNALKFTPPQGMISVRITETGDAPEGWGSYKFTVRDTGIGMNPEFLQHIFEPFERERTSTISGIQGTGLGMTITKNIVDMMHGSICVESEVGKGSAFTISFQFRLSSEPCRVETVPELKGLRALVADDDFNTCVSVTKMLSSIGMRPEWTTSGREAVLRAKLALEQEDEFDAYLIDWLMPDMNGIEVVRRIRRLIGGGKPIIILTAYDWADIETEAREAGVTAFCSKPLFLSELRAALLQSGHDIIQEGPAWSGMEDSFAGRRVLLVEDNELNQEIAATILEEAGLTVAMASDGAQAVEQVKNSAGAPFDLVLMDIQMPVLDGYEATQEIRRLDDPLLARVPIIAMSANAFEEDRQRGMEVGMNGYQGKPIEIEKLMDALKAVFSKETPPVP